jgi:hypothetical protein
MKIVVVLVLVLERKAEDEVPLRSLLRLPGKVERVNTVTQHENAKGKCGDDGHVGNLAKVDIATHLLVSIEGDHDPDHKKHSTHRLVKENAYGANQIVESGLQKPKHGHAASG